MKILKFFAAAVMVAAMMVSCAGGAKDGKVLLASAEDSLSYATGMMIAKEYKIPVIVSTRYDKMYMDKILESNHIDKTMIMMAFE